MWRQDYLSLGDPFYDVSLPTPVNDPHLFLWNVTLASSLGLPNDWVNNDELKAQIFSGNVVLPNTQPIALAYAGHQFGYFNAQLGDGRAHLLGEWEDRQGDRYDVQLKGSGPTRFSRRGDGRCAFKPALREYIMSEALFALGVPTTRCLSVVTTGEKLMRDTSVDGAIVTRIASSHIRVGSFQYFAERGDLSALRHLLNYAIERHYPEIDDHPHRAIAFLQVVMDKQIELIVAWMRIGFIHGVMNTDNCAISGETLDYGPCAMMGIYDPDTVFSSIDTEGRYAFGQQALIAQWNMARLAESLLPLVVEEESALETLRAIIMTFMPRFQTAYHQMQAQKLGFEQVDHNVTEEWLSQFWQLMQDNRWDYTDAFLRLQRSLSDKEEEEQLQSQCGEWYGQWRAYLHKSGISPQQASSQMATVNPLVIPRNHHIESVLAACEQERKPQMAEALLAVLSSPYEMTDNTFYYQSFKGQEDFGYRTYCGT